MIFRISTNLPINHSRNGMILQVSLSFFTMAIVGIYIHVNNFSGVLGRERCHGLEPHCEAERRAVRPLGLALLAEQVHDPDGVLVLVREHEWASEDAHGSGDAHHGGQGSDRLPDHKQAHLRVHERRLRQDHENDRVRVLETGHQRGEAVALLPDHLHLGDLAPRPVRALRFVHDQPSGRRDELVGDHGRVLGQMVSKSPKWGYSPYKWLINGGY